MTEPLILLTDETGVGASLPLALEGLPAKNDAGETIHYKRLRVVPTPPKGQQWADVKDGSLLDLKRQRLDEWIKNTNAMIGKGRKPFVTKRHNFDVPDPADTMGMVERLERDADELYAVVGLHGDDSLITAARNGRSIGVAKSNARDATGNTYSGEWLHHLAICPNSALPGLERFAASADHAPTAHIFALSTSGLAPERSPIMKPETLTKLRAKLNLPDTKAVPDAEVAERAAVLALADPPADKSAEVTALSADVTRLTTELAAANTAKETATLALSAAAPQKRDQLSLSLINRAFKAEGDKLISEGIISEAGWKELAGLCGVGSDSGVALALSAGSEDPFFLRLTEILKRFTPGIKTGNAVTRATSALELSGDGEHGTTDERKAYVAQCMGINLPKPHEVARSA